MQAYWPILDPWMKIYRHHHILFKQQLQNIPFNTFFSWRNWEKEGKKAIFLVDYNQIDRLLHARPLEEEKKSLWISFSTRKFSKKSRKQKGGEFSVDIKAKQSIAVPIQAIKNKTQNSSSLNKSKPSRKTSMKPHKKHTKSSNKDAKVACSSIQDQPSHSVSADRKHSLAKMNKTQANCENQEVEKSTFEVTRKLQQLRLPACTNIKLLQEYYLDLEDCFNCIQGPLYTFFMELHNYYVAPIKPLFEMLMPYEEFIARKEEMGKQIDQKIFENEKLLEELSPVEIQIFKLKEKIEENRVYIERKRQSKMQRLMSETQEKTKANQPKSYPSQPKSSQAQGGREVVRPEKIDHIGKGFKLDLQNINKQGQPGFHQQFYAKLPQFSESWRDQAIRQKRF